MLAALRERSVVLVTGASVALSGLGTVRVRVGADARELDADVVIACTVAATGAGDEVRRSGPVEGAGHDEHDALISLGGLEIPVVRVGEYAGNRYVVEVMRDALRAVVAL